MGGGPETTRSGSIAGASYSRPRTSTRILESLTSGILLLDQSGQPVFCNQAAESILQLSRTQVLDPEAPSPSGDITTESGKPCLAAESLPMREVLARGASYQRFECILRRLDGSRRRLGLNASPTFEPDGAISGALVEFADITDRRQSEQDRERLLAELEATINAITEAVIIYRPTGEIERMNPAAERLLGYSEQERQDPLPQRLARLKVLTPEGRPFPLRLVMARALREKVLQGEIAVLHRADRKIWLSASAAPIRYSDGTLFGVVGTATDITPLREMQEEQALGLHTISHDLRTPLTVINGHAHLLHDIIRQSAMIRGEEHLDAILQGVQQMNRMLGELAETARLEGGCATCHSQPIDLADFLRVLLSRLERILPGKCFDVEVPPNIPRAWADPSSLERILSNLINNAHRYAPAHGRIQVHVKEGQEAQEVEIIVRDEGPGLSPGEAAHLFDRFYRGNQPESREDYQGLGLGLYICRRLVEMQKGRIWVESPPGQGCAFHFTLPVEH